MKGKFAFHAVLGGYSRLYHFGKQIQKDSLRRHSPKCANKTLQNSCDNNFTAETLFTRTARNTDKDKKTNINKLRFKHKKKHSINMVSVCKDLVEHRRVNTQKPSA